MPEHPNPYFYIYVRADAAFGQDLTSGLADITDPRKLRMSQHQDGGAEHVERRP